MQDKILSLPIVVEVIRIATNMYNLGYDERNGGNISVLLEDSIKDYLPKEKIRSFSFDYDASYLAGRYFLVTGTGKFFRNVQYFPSECLGIIRINEKGNGADLYWGFSNGGAPTSELPTHLMNHIERLKKDPKHRVVLHCHPTHTLAMTYVIPEDEDEITRTLWRMSTECIVVFPEGIGYLPWMLCGGKEIGEATAKKIKDYRLVIWGMHGVFATGESIDEAFGLLETVEKAATIYFLVKDNIKQTITNQDLIKLANAFKVNYKKIL
jgi:rhamnulose-1-phosphate aldolase